MVTIEASGIAPPALYTAPGLLDLVHQAGASVVGLGIVIEKSFQEGRQLMEDQGIRVTSLARLARFDQGQVVFAPADAKSSSSDELFVVMGAEKRFHAAGEVDGFLLGEDEALAGWLGLELSQDLFHRFTEKLTGQELAG